ncbi:unnamed protein product [[Actinomadura] parvosata subsp. kistnae]|nr:unnamed protein product [Actinomadura parvosata subsp. kistnae]
MYGPDATSSGAARARSGIVGTARYLRALLQDPSHRPRSDP